MAFDISIAFSSITALIAIWSAVESHKANTRAAEANQKAERANKLSEQSNEHALRANEISAQAYELAERLAPAPLSELTQVSKNKWTFVNQSGRMIELLSISVIPEEVTGLVRAPSLPTKLDYEDHFILNIQEVHTSGVEALIIEWRFEGSSETQQSRCNVFAT